MFEAETMSEVRKKAMGLQRRRWPSIAPRFFVASDSVICALAFAHARQGRSKVIQEVLWRIHLSFSVESRKLLCLCHSIYTEKVANQCTRPYMRKYKYSLESPCLIHLQLLFCNIYICFIHTYSLIDINSTYMHACLHNIYIYRTYHLCS